MKKVGAPYGNKNNEKWTLETSQKFLNKVFEYVHVHHDCTSLEKACTEIGEYEELITYIEKKEIEGINFQPIKKAKAFIKQRLIDKGLKSEYNPTMCIFILKNNHDMKDKQDIDANVDVKNIKGITFNE